MTGNLDFLYFVLFIFKISLCTDSFIGLQVDEVDPEDVTYPDKVLCYTGDDGE